MTVFILLLLGFVGLALVFVGLSWLVVAISRHPHLLRISGTVLNIETKDERTGDERGVSFFPIISYKTPEGSDVRFRSKTGVFRPVRSGLGGSSPVSPWRVGQKIDIFHDSEGKLDPCIASLWNLYSWPLGFLAGGILLLMIVVNKWNHLGG